MLRCISELGLVLLLNIKNVIYVGGLLHCSFMNHRFNKLDEYMPFYHEYMSVSSKTEDKIVKAEQQIFPHLSFMQIWSEFVKDKNANNDIDEIINTTKKQLNKLEMLYNTMKK